MQKAICLSSREPLSAVLSALVKLFAGHRAGIWGRLCSRRAFTAALGPGTGSGSEHQEHRLCAAVLPWVLQCCQGRAVPCTVNFGGKQLGFHLSRFMDKFTGSCSSWLGLCHFSWTPIPMVVGPLLTLLPWSLAKPRTERDFPPPFSFPGSPLWCNLPRVFSSTVWWGPQ